MMPFSFAALQHSQMQHFQALQHQQQQGQALQGPGTSAVFAPASLQSGSPYSTSPSSASSMPLTSGLPPSPLQPPLTPLSAVRSLSAWTSSAPPCASALSSPLHSAASSSSGAPTLSNHLHQLHLTAGSGTAAPFAALPSSFSLTAPSLASSGVALPSVAASSTAAAAQTQTHVLASAFSSHVQQHAAAAAVAALGSPKPVHALSSQGHTIPFVSSLLQRHIQQQQQWQAQQSAMSQAQPLPFILPPSSFSSALSSSLSPVSDPSPTASLYTPGSPAAPLLPIHNTTSSTQPSPARTSSSTSSSLSLLSPSASADATSSALLRRAELAEQQRDAALTAIQRVAAALKAYDAAASPNWAQLALMEAAQLLTPFLGSLPTPTPLSASVGADAGASGGLIGLKRRNLSAFHAVPGQGGSRVRELLDGLSHTAPAAVDRLSSGSGGRRNRKKRRKSGSSAATRSDSESAHSSASGGGHTTARSTHGSDGDDAKLHATRRRTSHTSDSDSDTDDDDGAESEHREDTAVAVLGPVPSTARVQASSSPPNVLLRLSHKKKRDRSCLPCPLIHHINKTPIRVVDVHIEREFTLSKRDAAALSREEKAALVKVGVRFLANSASSSEVYVVAKDICLLIHTRKGNVAKSIGQFGAGEKARMAVICPRSDGTVSTHVLTVLSVGGVRRLLAGSRSRVIGKVRGWMYYQLCTMGHPEAALFNESDTGASTQLALGDAAAASTTDSSSDQSKSDESSPSNDAAVAQASKAAEAAAALGLSASDHRQSPSSASLHSVMSTPSLSSSAPSSPSPSMSHTSSPQSLAAFSFAALSAGTGPAVRAASAS